MGGLERLARLAAPLAIVALAGCASMPVFDGPDVPEQPRIETTEVSDFDYGDFEQRRAKAADDPKLRFSGQLPGGIVDPTFPAAIGNSIAVVDDPVMMDRLSVALEDLLATWPHDHPEVAVVVTDDPSFSPAVTPGATIVIPRGFLEQTGSLDQLNFVLAHELSHVLLDHFRDAEQSKRVEQILTETSGVVHEVETMLNERDNGGDSEVSEVVDAIGIGVMFGNQYIFGPAFNRAQELEADQLGLDIAMRAGYSIPGAYSTLHLIMSLHEQQREEFEERCGKIQWSVISGTLQKIPGAKEVRERVDATLQPQIKREQDAGCARGRDLLGLLFNKKSHPDPEQRWEKIQEYVDGAYPTVNITPQRSESESNLLNLMSPEGALARSSMADRALRELNQGNLAEAERLAYESLDGADDPTPRPRWAMYKVRRAQYHNTDDESYLRRALTNLEVAADGGYAPRRVFLRLADEYAEQERYEDAIATLQQAGEKFDDRAMYYPREISYLREAGSEEELQATLILCEETENRDLIARCHSAAAREAGSTGTG